MKSRTTWILLAVGGVALVLAQIVAMSSMRWDGGFPDVELQLSFLDGNGSPVPGVELQVEDPVGNVVYYFPVTDYGPGQIPTSDASGTMVLRHLHIQGLEFGGSCTLLFGFEFGSTCDSPAYLCRFLLNGKEVHHSTFRDLIWAAPVPKEEVVRNWSWLEHGPSRLPGETDEALVERAFQDEEARPHRTRETMVARNAILSIVECQMEVARGARPASEEQTFTLIRRTITLK
ncbi:hypothetical protein [Planctomicrobium piriforme]|uniref:Uncharacterized protein n=1 Tax=Planctomicrobium piriforme TaxID=1576369 RepID=A0A1I3BL49_9PLAN|nr:hypothetical protein [Planctomicrobium piriforme]SFH62988.1 hypothetical protein SAMN05421753_101515 [Planctomicrobium piriforme]